MPKNKDRKTGQRGGKYRPVHCTRAVSAEELTQAHGFFFSNTPRRYSISSAGDIYADRVTYKHCERFHQYCADKGLRPASVNTHIRLVKRIFSLAVKRGQLEQNTFNGIPLLKVPKKPVRVFGKVEFESTLVAARSPIWKARILLAKTAGLRRGEILNLTVNDVDSAKGRIMI
jgi:integrase